MYGRGTVGGPFTLTDQNGKLRSDSEFRGRLMIVYFGYTFCPDVCPTDLMAITQALDGLGKDAAGVQPIFITIDPERDNRVMADYLTISGHSTQASSGSPVRRMRSAKSPMPTRNFTPGSRIRAAANIFIPPQTAPIASLRSCANILPMDRVRRGIDAKRANALASALSKLARPGFVLRHSSF